MGYQDRLDIILITYNRCDHLRNTLKQIFAESSPIRNYPITILDNKSTDGSSELIQEYCKKFPKIKNIRHNRNIGGNANIARAFEVASKEYVWVLCDDDEFDFTHWADVEDAMQARYDGILVSNYSNPTDNIAQLIGQMAFVPSTIYRTEHITDTVMMNAEFSIAFMFPQLAFATKLINDNLRIKILDHWIVNMVPHANETSYTRGMDNDKHPLMANMFWQIGFLNSLNMVKDKSIRQEIIDKLTLNLNSRDSFLETSRIEDDNIRLGKNSIWNIATAYANMATIDKSYSISLSSKVNRFSNIDNDGVTHLIFEICKKDKSILFLTTTGKKLKLWDARWIRLYRTKRGVYFQLAKKIKFKIFPLKVK